MLIILLFCHYLADFCFTWPAMIRAKSDGHTLWPILQHALIHTVLVAICLAIWGIRWKLLVMLSILELLTHFLIDWGKGRLSARFPFLSDNKRKPYWMLFGFDQFLHISVIAFIWYGSFTF